MTDANHLERIQKVATGLVTGLHHLPYADRLQRRRVQDINVPMDVDPNLFFLFISPTRRGLRGHPNKVLRGKSHRRRREPAFSVRIVKYWNMLPASVFTAPLSIFSSVNRYLSPLSSPPPLSLSTFNPPVKNHLTLVSPNSLYRLCGFVTNRFAVC